MFKRLKKLLLGNLRKQLTIGMVLAVATMISLFVWDMTRRQQTIEIKQHSEQISALANSVATTSAVWVISRDYSGLQEIIQGISRYPHLRHAIVFDLKGQVLAHNDPTKIGLYLTELPSEVGVQILQHTASLIDVISPIMLADKQIGWVQIGLDRAPFNTELHTLKLNGLFYGLISIVLSIFFAILTSKYLTRRLYLIQQVAEAVHAGKSDLRTIVTGDDEAAVLARQFNEMLDSLAQREDILQRSETFKNAILNSVPAEIAVLDRDGVIQAVNEPWIRFSLENSSEPDNAVLQSAVGVNYLKVCEASVNFTIDDDALNASQGIQSVLDGKLSSFSLEYPCHSSEQQRWFSMNVMPLGIAPITGVVVTHTDITAIKRTEEIQIFLAKTTSELSSESFFETLARYLSEFLGMFYVCIDRLEGDGLNARTLAVWCDDHFEDNVTYALKDTPCGDVVGQSVCCFPVSVCQFFPRDQILQDLCAESYIGVTLWSHTGQPIGLIAVIGRTALVNRPLAESILQLVSVRASGELERLFAEEKLQLSASVFSHSHEAIFITEPDGTIIDVNDAFTCITGFSRAEVLGKNPRLLSSGRQSKEFYAVLWREIIENGYWSGEVWNRRKNGEIYAELLTISAVRSAEGNIQNYVALFSDISAFKEHENQLEHIAHYDALTTLPNRVLLADRMHQAMALAQRRGQPLAVAFLDLDGFKAINDRYGHPVGDQLLMTVASRMKQTLRECDTLARLGGDEFVAVLLELEDVNASIPMLNRLLAAAAEPLHIGDLVLNVSASLGVTFYPQVDDIDADQLLRQSDQAMYQAKLAGRNRYHIFDAEQDSNIRVHHESLERIRCALCEGEFVMYYQPKVNMRTGAVIGAEALIRWQHPVEGLLQPAVFLPVIEDHSLAVEIGDWVINTVLTQIESWHAIGLNLPVSINVSARQLQQPDFVVRLQDILATHPIVRPYSIELEILETSALEDLAGVSRVIEACREIGVLFALDDFGTGYSSLTYLKRLPVTLLKIDQSFVCNMLEDPDDLAILQGVLGLAAAFHREVIAEGVETIEHGEMLLQLGCELAQGYGISHPIPAEEMPYWVDTWRPPPSWLNLAVISRDDLPLLFASVEHCAWISAMQNHLKGNRSEPPPMDNHHCNFSVWLDGEGLVRHGTQPAFQVIESLHRRVHELAAELLKLHVSGRNKEALARITELLDLRDLLIKQLKKLT